MKFFKSILRIAGTVIAVVVVAYICTILYSKYDNRLVHQTKEEKTEAYKTFASKQRNQRISKLKCQRAGMRSCFNLGQKHEGSDRQKSRDYYYLGCKKKDFNSCDKLGLEGKEIKQAYIAKIEAAAAESKRKSKEWHIDDEIFIMTFVFGLVFHLLYSLIMRPRGYTGVTWVESILIIIGSLPGIAGCGSTGGGFGFPLPLALGLPIQIVLGFVTNCGWEQFISHSNQYLSHTALGISNSWISANICIIAHLYAFKLVRIALLARKSKR